MASKHRRTQPTAHTLAASSAPPPPVVGKGRPGSATTRGRSAPVDWEGFSYGPYEKFPSAQQAVMDGYLMQRYDPTIGSAFSLLSMLICGHLGEYKHENPRIEEFVRGDLDKISGGLRSTVNALLSSLWAGYAIAERVWATEGSAWHLERLDLLHPLTFFPRQGGDKAGIVLDPAEGRVKEVVQYPWKFGEEPVPFPVADVVYWPFMRQLREEVYGRRLTDRARRPWYMRVKIESFWGIFCERFAHPTPIFQVPKGQQVDAQGNPTDNATFYAQAINALAPGRGWAIECDADETFKFDLLETKVGGDRSYQTACSYWNAESWKSVLMSPLILEEPAHGSRAQTSTVFEVALMLVDAIRAELGGVLVHQVARPLIEYNFGSVDDYGEYEWDELRQDDLESMATIVERVVRAGAIAPTPADEARLREKFADAGFAQVEDLTEEDLAAQAEGKQLRLPVGYGV